MAKPRILALNLYYLPGYKGGGSIRALVNLVGHLKDEFEFVVATDARDLNELEPYSVQAQAEAIAAEGYDIRYFSGSWDLIRGLRGLLAQHWDLIYLNSAFSPGFTALPLLLNRISRGRKVPVVLAPRGELMEGALRTSRAKFIKKTLFLGLVRITRHFHGVTIHSTSPVESTGISSLNLGISRIAFAPDLPPRLGTDISLGDPKKAERLRVVFISRIDPKKNLHFALEVIQGVQAAVDFDIVGPIGDEAYWLTCQKVIAALPEHIQVRHLGPVPHEEILRVFAAHDLFFFPTQAENNGYVILESLLAGCPLLLSDRTPWRGLRELGVGRDLPLEDPGAFSAAIEELAAMGPAAHTAMRERAQAYGRERLLAAEDVAATRAMFREAMG
jgi:glycosyltransferase involved in cell wall biosynthesis